MTEGPKYPGVLVALEDLWGSAGNAYEILGRIKRALIDGEQGGDCDEGAAAAFYAEATSGDYDHLLATVDAYVDAYVVLSHSKSRLDTEHLCPLSEFRKEYAKVVKENH
jgi:hypothetical protein